MKIKEAIIVEGKYDKIRLQSFLDAHIIATTGFDIFKNTETKEYIKKLAMTKGIVILTDSDYAGFKIRNYIKSFVDETKGLFAIESLQPSTATARIWFPLVSNKIPFKIGLLSSCATA